MCSEANIRLEYSWRSMTGHDQTGGDVSSNNRAIDSAGGMSIMNRRSDRVPADGSGEIWRPRKSAWFTTGQPEKIGERRLERTARRGGVGPSGTNEPPHHMARRRGRKTWTILEERGVAASESGTRPENMIARADTLVLCRVSRS